MVNIALQTGRDYFRHFVMLLLQKNDYSERPSNFIPGDLLLETVLERNRSGLFYNIPFYCREQIDAIIHAKTGAPGVLVLSAKARKVLGKLLDELEARRPSHQESHYLGLKTANYVSARKVHELRQLVLKNSPSCDGYELDLISRINGVGIEQNKIYFIVEYGQIKYTTSLVEGVFLEKNFFLQRENLYEQLCTAINENKLENVSELCKKTVLGIALERGHISEQQDKDTILSTKERDLLLNELLFYIKPSSEDIPRIYREEMEKLSGTVPLDKTDEAGSTLALLAYQYKNGKIGRWIVSQSCGVFERQNLAGLSAKNYLTADLSFSEEEFQKLKAQQAALNLHMAYLQYWERLWSVEHHKLLRRVEESEKSACGSVINGACSLYDRCSQSRYAFLARRPFIENNTTLLKEERYTGKAGGFYTGITAAQVNQIPTGLTGRTRLGKNLNKAASLLTPFKDTPVGFAVSREEMARRAQEEKAAQVNVQEIAQTMNDLKTQFEVFQAGRAAETNELKTQFEVMQAEQVAQKAERAAQKAERAAQKAERKAEEAKFEAEEAKREAEKNVYREGGSPVLFSSDRASSTSLSPVLSPRVDHV